MAIRHVAPGYRGALAFVVTAITSNLLLAIAFLLVAPDKVPSHFNAIGAIDSWSTKTTAASSLLTVGAGLPILMAIPWPWGKRPSLLNLPYKNDWIATGRRQGLTDRVVVFMRLLGGLMALLADVILLVTLIDPKAESRAEIAPGWVLVASIGIFVIGAGLCLWKVFRDLKPAW